MNSHTDEFGTPLKVFEDYLREPSAQGKAYEVARSGKWKEREQFTGEDRAQVYKIET